MTQREKKFCRLVPRVYGALAPACRRCSWHERYLIESPHTDENCDSVVQNIHAAGYLHFFEWGCKDGVHSGWAIVEAENHERAKQIVPWQVRDQARVVKLVKFEVADPEHESRKSKH